MPLLPRLRLPPTLRTSASTRAARPFSSTSAPKTYKSTHPFSFLPSNSLSPKPRTIGLTEIRGPYYAPVTQTYLDELLSDWGEYVDGIKFAGGAFSLMPKERLQGLIDVAHKHGERCSLLEDDINKAKTDRCNSQIVMYPQAATSSASLRPPPPPLNPPTSTST